MYRLMGWEQHPWTFDKLVDTFVSALVKNKRIYVIMNGYNPIQLKIYIYFTSSGLN